VRGRLAELKGPTFKGTGRKGRKGREGRKGKGEEGEEKMRKKGCPVFPEPTWQPCVARKLLKEGSLLCTHSFFPLYASNFWCYRFYSCFVVVIK